MIKKLTVIVAVFFGIHLFYAWGSTGHRVIGEVAEKNIKKRTARKIAKILNHESLASTSTFGDDIKSDDRYKKFYEWHYEDFEYGKKHENSDYHDGNLLKGMDYCINLLKDKSSSAEDKVFYLKFLIHLVGDLHQPLHVGDKKDKGGNDIKVKWFGAPSNLHKVWDEDMISQFGMSYTELAQNLPYLNQNEKESICSGTLSDWMYESQKIAFTDIYLSVKQDEALSYRYQYVHFGTVKKQLQKAGLRLATILDQIFS